MAVNLDNLHIPQTFVGIAKDVKSAFNFTCAKILPERLSTKLGGPSKSNISWANTKATTFWLMETAARIGAFVALIGLAGAAIYTGAAIAIQNGALLGLSPWLMTETVEKAVTFGAMAVGGCVLLETITQACAYVMDGIKTSIAANITQQNWGWTPPSLDWV